MRRNKNAEAYEVHKLSHLRTKERLSLTDRALFGRRAKVGVSKPFAPMDPKDTKSLKDL